MELESGVMALCSCGSKRDHEDCCGPIISLSSFLTATRYEDAAHLAQLQLPILNDYMAKTAGNVQLAEFHKNYENWFQEMTYLFQRP